MIHRFWRDGNESKVPDDAQRNHRYEARDKPQDDEWASDPFCLYGL